MHDTNLLENQPIAWTPTPEVIERSQLMRFMKQVGVETWDELYQFSIRDVEKFTEEVLKFLDIKFDPPYEKLLDTSNGPEFPTWLAANSTPVQQAETRPVGRVPHAGLNITEMCLDRWQKEDMKDQPALIWEGEEGESFAISYEILFREVRYCAEELRSYGLGKGDAIGIHLPMMYETVIALLAISRIGAIAVPVFSGYGVDAISSRLNAVGANALFTCDGYPRRGKSFNSFAVAEAAIENCPTIQRVWIANRVNDRSIWQKHEDSAFFFLEFDEICRRDSKAQFPEPTSAEDPLIILYTSGTTGKPKGIAHTHASFPIKAAQDMAFGTDVGRGTRICWYTDIGWMMGPWLIYGALINGATVCIYDGAPDYPTHDRMWEFCAKHKVEVLGISPTLVRALAAHEAARPSSPPYEAGAPARASRNGVDVGGVAAASADGVVLSEQEDLSQSRKDAKEETRKKPYERHDLSSLRAFASTGEPWNPAPWWWLFEEVGNSKLPIINYSGGTEIAGGILMGNPLLPIKPCSFPAPCPGMDVDVLNENSEPVNAGEVGELVIKQPWIGMARGFWQEKERYLETYWSRFKNIWVHGDWAIRDADGHWFILGRSDDTLKVAGKRVGPAEVESLLIAHPLVIEAAVIGVPDEAKGTAMVAFCVLSIPPAVAGGDLSTQRRREAKAAQAETRPVGSVRSEASDLEKDLKELVAKNMGKPLAPSRIHFVSALPKTRNAKVMRRVIRAAYLGKDPGDLSALENPQAVDEIAKLIS